MEMETLYKVSSQGIGHNTIRASQKSFEDL
jgi:hypothetical protein